MQLPKWTEIWHGFFLNWNPSLIFPSPWPSFSASSPSNINFYRRIEKLKMSHPDLYVSTLTRHSCIIQDEDFAHIYHCSAHRKPMLQCFTRYQQRLATLLISRLISLPCWSFSRTNWFSYGLMCGFLHLWSTNSKIICSYRYCEHPQFLYLIQENGMGTKMPLQGQMELSANISLNDKDSLPLQLRILVLCTLRTLLYHLYPDGTTWLLSWPESSVTFSPHVTCVAWSELIGFDY